MISQQVTAIALRLISIWLLIQLLLDLPSLVMLFAGVAQYQQQEIPQGAYFGIIGSFLLVGLIAVFLINKTATSVLAQAKTESEESLSNDSQKLLFQVAGLYFVIDAIVDLPRSLGFIPGATGISLSNMLWPVGLVFQLAIGVWLASNSSFWLNFFQRLRGRA